MESQMNKANPVSPRLFLKQGYNYMQVIVLYTCF